MLKGEKVVLRALEKQDLSRLHELNQNVDLILLASGFWEPDSLAQREKDFEEHLKDEESSWFALEVEGNLIGDLGLHHRDRRASTAQIGIAILDPAYLGKGLGRDAINVLMRYAFHIQNYRRLWLDTAGNNERAIRCYLACGFQEEGRLRQHIFWQGGYIDLVMMGLLRSEWEAQQTNPAK